MSRPVVDVVVVTWNVREEAAACIASVLASRDVEVRPVVVDNASEDGSAEVLAERFPTLRLLRNSVNLGFARAANQGIAAGAAPWIFLLNPDAIVPPDALARLVRRLEHLPGHAAVVPRLVDGDGRHQHSVHLFPSLVHSLLLAVGPRRILSPPARRARLVEGDWEGDVERDVPWAVGAAMLLRRAALERVGPLDESFFLYAEDLEWCDRATAAGWRIRFCPDVVVTHLGNRSGARLYGSQRTAAYLHNTVRFLRRRHGVVWTAAWVAINGGAVLGHATAASVRARLRPSPESRHLQGYWTDQAAFYRQLPQRALGRLREPRPARSVLVLGSHYPPHVLGGYELVCASWVETLRRRGDDVTVLCSSYGCSQPTVERGRHGEVVARVLDWRWRDFRLLRPTGPELWRQERRQWQELRRWVRRRRPQVAVVWQMAGLSKALLAGLDRLDLPIVAVIGEPWPAWDVDSDPWCPFWDRQPRRLASRLAKPLLRRVAEAAVAPTGLERALRTTIPVVASDHLRVEVERSRPEWRGRTRVVPHGIDLATVRRQRDDAEPLAAPLRLLVVGRVEPRKGVHVAVETLALLHRRGVDARLRIVGWRDEVYAARLRALAADLGVAAAIAVDDAVEHHLVGDVYRAADVLLFPVLWDEPFGLVPLEAMATGCLVVASGTGGSAEFLRDQANCLLVPRGDAAAMADAIARLVADPGLVARLRQGGRETAERHDVAEFAAALDAILEEVGRSGTTIGATGGRGGSDETMPSPQRRKRR